MSEVSTLGGVFVDGPAQVEVGDDFLGSQPEDLSHGALDGRVVRPPGSERIHPDRDRFRAADRVGELHLGPARQFRGDDVLGDGAGHVGGRAVHLRRVLARKGAASVAGHATVRVNDNLPARESAVGRRAALHELAGWIDEDRWRAGAKSLRQHREHHPFLDVANDATGSFFRVLGGGDDRGNRHGVPGSVVGHRDLRLSVRAQIRDVAAGARLGQAPRDPVSQHDRQRHQLRRLVAGEPEHHSLVSRAPRVHAHRDVGGLPAHVDLDVDRVGVEIVVPPGVSDAPDRAADHGFEFRPRGSAPRRCFAGDHGAAGGDERFAGDPGQGVPSQERVENGVGNLVRNLVRMAFGHRLRGKEPHVAGWLHAYGTPSSFWGLDGWGETTFAVRLGMRLLEERAMLAARLPRCLGVAGAGANR